MIFSKLRKIISGFGKVKLQNRVEELGEFFSIILKDYGGSLSLEKYWKDKAESVKADFKIASVKDDINEIQVEYLPVDLKIVDSPGKRIVKTCWVVCDEEVMVEEIETTLTILGSKVDKKNSYIKLSGSGVHDEIVYEVEKAVTLTEWFEEKAGLSGLL